MFVDVTMPWFCKGTILLYDIAIYMLTPVNVACQRSNDRDPVWNSRKVTTVGTFFGIFLTKSNLFSQARGLTDETHDEGQPRKALHSALKQPARTGGELRRSRAGQTT